MLVKAAVLILRWYNGLRTEVDHVTSADREDSGDASFEGCVKAIRTGVEDSGSEMIYGFGRGSIQHGADFGLRYQPLHCFAASLRNAANLPRRFRMGVPVESYACCMKTVYFRRLVMRWLAPD